MSLYVGCWKERQSMLETAKIIAIETTTAVYDDLSDYPKSARTLKPFPDVFRLKLTLVDLDNDDGSVEREFICVEGAERARIEGAMKEVGARWEGDHRAQEYNAAEVDRLTSEVELLCRFAGFLKSCIKAGEQTDMTFEEFGTLERAAGR